MIKYFLKRVERPSDLLLLLKFIQKGSGVNDSYWSKMIDRINNGEYLIIGIYEMRSCKTCIVKYTPEMIGFMYTKLDDDLEELDVMTFSLDAEYYNNEVINNTITNYLKKLMNDLQIKQIKFHSRVRPKEWYEKFLNDKLIEYSTYVWRGNG